MINSVILEVDALQVPNGTNALPSFTFENNPNRTV